MIKKPVSKKKTVVKKRVIKKKVVEIADKPLRPLRVDDKHVTVLLGCDPEAFFVKDNAIIGSEKVIAKKGLEHTNGKIIRDGVQLEFNPNASTCRELLRFNIIYAFRELSDELKKENNKGISVSMKQTVTLSEEEMNSLSDESKQFGCVPSYNVYNNDCAVGVADASKFFSRSAGGHIHLGVSRGTKLHETLQDAKRLVPVLDLLLGNTCVMIDTDEGNKIRRQTYGRAGEFRLPKHGLEYRTLSNFWMRNYTLMSFVMGIARQAVQIVHHSTEENDYAGRLMALVDINDVRNAINNNDRELAKKNFDKIKGFIKTNIIEDNNYAPVTLSNKLIDLVEYFLSKPLDYWFLNNNDVIGTWLGKYHVREGVLNHRGGYYGAESFLNVIVRDDMEKNKKN